MLLRDGFDLEGWQIEILGTEVSAAMLDRARAGRYGQLETSRGLPPELLQRHFHPVGERWEIDPEIRAMVRFERHNLVDPWPVLAPMDLVLMRNVLLYFDRPTRRRMLTAVGGVLAPEGYLLLGAAETIANDVVGFERWSLAPTGWYRREGTALRAAGA
jgi:chemotaxis protein methyltransferase CheR